MKLHTGAAVGALFLISVGASGTAQGGLLSAAGIPGCAPLCLQPALTRPGNLPPGKYKTVNFFAGQMTLSFPKGWFSGEDSTGEFSAWSRATPDAKLLFWEDVYSVTASRPIGSWQRVGPLRRTSASLLSWLRANPNLRVSTPTPGRIGSISARVVDVRVSTRAKNDDPGCPEKACANFIQFPQWDGPYGIAGTKAVTRVYIADVRYGDARHLFVVAVEALSTPQLQAFLPTAKKLIATVRVPATAI
jgi:hypothetical protein